MTSTTDALDLDSMLDVGTEVTSDDATSLGDPDVTIIRKQLEGLEGMYSEVSTQNYEKFLIPLNE